jgi:hypothetical protein
VAHGKRKIVSENSVFIVRDAARKRILYLPHALDGMNISEELITPDEVRSVIRGGEIIEDYPEDARGHSCLMLGYGTDERPIHVVCSPKDEYLAIITVYLPDERRWEADWRTRKSRT